MGRLLNPDVVEPEDMSFAAGNLGPVVIVRFEVSVDNGVGMVSIRFVDMCRSDDERHYEPRRECERDGRPPQRMHDFGDYGSWPPPRQTL